MPSPLQPGSVSPRGLDLKPLNRLRVLDQCRRRRLAESVAANLLQPKIAGRAKVSFEVFVIHATIHSGCPWECFFLRTVRHKLQHKFGSTTDGTPVSTTAVSSEHQGFPRGWGRTFLVSVWYLYNAWNAINAPHRFCKSTRSSSAAGNAWRLRPTR